MWREYPSTVEEPWKSSIEGKYYARQIIKARADGRIGKFPVRPGIPLNGFWDIGASDTQVCWLHQEVNGWDHWVACRGGHGEGFLPMIRWIETFDAPIGTMYLPHDAEQKKNSVQAPTSLYSQIKDAKPGWTWRIVPVVSHVQHAIDLVRMEFGTYCFDEEGCKEGLLHLENYRRKWNTRLACWDNEPEHDDASDYADAFRQKAQGYQPSQAAVQRRAPKRAGVRRGIIA